MNVLITLTFAGSGTGPFNLLTDVDGYTTPFVTGVTRSSLISGYATSLVPDNAFVIRCKSTGICLNYIDIPIQNIPTPTPTPTTTATLTPTPTTTATLTSTPSTTPTMTKTPTNTPTNTPTISITPSNTRTQTPSVTPTFTPSPTRNKFTYVVTEYDANCNAGASYNLNSNSLLTTNRWYCEQAYGRIYIAALTTYNPGNYTMTINSGPYTPCSGAIPCA
jgi:hypothetical protein